MYSRYCKTSLTFVFASFISYVAFAAEDIIIRERPFPKNEKVSFSVFCGSKITSVTIGNGEKGGSKILDASRAGLGATKDSVAKVNATINRSRSVYLSSPYCEGKNSVSFLVSGSYLDAKLGEVDDFTLRLSLEFDAG